jgi:glycosyltransferase involved in cell wall biosynthesis
LLLIKSLHMQPISATLITYNEENNIAQALKSLSWADEILVVDSGSSDATVEICRSFNSRIIHRNWTGYVDQKNFAVEEARNDWIFSLDADERVSPELIREIEELNRRGFSSSGYKIPRAAFFMGRWIRHGSWYPDYQLRLFDRRTGKWEGGRVHESVRMRGNPAFLSGEILHYSYRNISEYLVRLETYSSLAALDYGQKGKRATFPGMICNPIAVFLKSYLMKRGFLDGTPGLVVAAMAAVSVFFKYSKLYEIQLGNTAGSGQ